MDAYCRHCGHKLRHINGLCERHPSRDQYPLKPVQQAALAEFRETLEAAIVLVEDLEEQAQGLMLPLNRSASDARLGRALGALRKLRRTAEG